MEFFSLLALVVGSAVGFGVPGYRGRRGGANRDLTAEERHAAKRQRRELTASYVAAVPPEAPPSLPSSASSSTAVLFDQAPPSRHPTAPSSTAVLSELPAGQQLFYGTVCCSTVTQTSMV